MGRLITIVSMVKMMVTARVIALPSNLALPPLIQGGPVRLVHNQCWSSPRTTRPNTMPPSRFQLKWTSTGSHRPWLATSRAAKKTPVASTFRVGNTPRRAPW